MRLLSLPAFLDRLRQSEMVELVDLAAAERVIHDAWGIAIDISKKKVEPAAAAAQAEPTDGAEE